MKKIIMRSWVGVLLIISTVLLFVSYPALKDRVSLFFLERAESRLYEDINNVYSKISFCQVNTDCEIIEDKFSACGYIEVNKKLEKGDSEERVLLFQELYKVQEKLLKVRGIPAVQYSCVKEPRTVQCVDQRCKAIGERDDVIRL
jgi:hypothetical protein